MRVDEAHAYILLTGATGSRKGMLVIEGAREAIDQIFWSKEWKTLVVTVESKEFSGAVSATNSTDIPPGSVLRLHGEAQREEVPRGGDLLHRRRVRDGHSSLLRCTHPNRRPP